MGGSLAVKLSTAGHDVQVADARGIEAVRAEVLESGVRAVELEESVRGRDAIILAIPFGVAGKLVRVGARRDGGHRLTHHVECVAVLEPVAKGA
ncbi:NAD(P)-binding domain-containing protein [Streptomyces canus]|uniref:NAD(P)-binding domain-containing protein n=1 Tax=Streptomyces canus TaxID=58343 RepID=UPI0036E00B64